MLIHVMSSDLTLSMDKVRATLLCLSMPVNLSKRLILLQVVKQIQNAKYLKALAVLEKIKFHRNIFRLGLVYNL